MMPGVGLLANLARHLQHAVEIRALAKRALAGALDHRAIGHRIAERHAELDDFSPGGDRSQRDIARHLERRDHRR